MSGTPTPAPGPPVPRKRGSRAGLILLLVLLYPLPPAAAVESDFAPKRAGSASVDLLLSRESVGPLPRVSGDVPPPVPDVSSASYIVADLDTGAVLAARDPHGAYEPASTLKTLTAVTLIPRLDPRTRITPTAADVATDGTRVGLDPRLRYSVQELLASMLVMSANDSASALLRHAGPQGLSLLNQQACILQANDTLALTPHGLDALGQRSSAYDLALIARYGLRHQPTFKHMVGLRITTITGPGGARLPVYTHDRLLLNYPGALGVKNGYTRRARASFVGAAERDGRRLVVVVMRGNSGSWREAAQLLDWGFAAHPTLQPVGTLADPLPASERGRCPLRPVGTQPQRALPPSPAPQISAAPVVPVTLQQPAASGPPWGQPTAALCLLAILAAGGALAARGVRRLRP